MREKIQTKNKSFGSALVDKMLIVAITILLFVGALIFYMTKMHKGDDTAMRSHSAPAQEGHLPLPSKEPAPLDDQVDDQVVEVVTRANGETVHAGECPSGIDDKSCYAKESLVKRSVYSAVVDEINSTKATFSAVVDSAKKKEVFTVQSNAGIKLQKVDDDGNPMKDLSWRDLAKGDHVVISVEDGTVVGIYR